MYFFAETFKLQILSVFINSPDKIFDVFEVSSMPIALDSQFISVTFTDKEVYCKEAYCEEAGWRFVIKRL